jgi:hypothetical protein
MPKTQLTIYKYEIMYHSLGSTTKIRGEREVCKDKLTDNSEVV